MTLRVFGQALPWKQALPWERGRPARLRTSTTIPEACASPCAGGRDARAPREEVDSMWRCLNCETQIDDKHTFCWQCGKKRVLQPETKAHPRKEPAVPHFASFEQLAPEPQSHGLIFRRGPHTRLLAYLLVLVLFVILKILSSRFFGAYGLYIFVAVAFIALILILWRFFRRDPSEGVGIKLR